MQILFAEKELEGKNVNIISRAKKTSDGRSRTEILDGFMPNKFQSFKFLIMCHLSKEQRTLSELWSSTHSELLILNSTIRSLP